MNIYLDVNGVLLTKDCESAKGVTIFLKYIIENHTVYWLTTHCKGNTEPVVSYLQKYLPKEAYQLIKEIKPTTWGTLKTDAIDFTQDFLWFDDYVMKAEKKVLIKNNVLNKQILINLEDNPNQLLEITNNLC